MAIRSSAAALLKQLQSDLTAVMGQKAAPTSDLPRTVLALLDKFTEMTRVKPIGRQDLLTVLSVVNYIFDKIPHVIGTLAMTLSLLQKVLKLYMALGDKNRAASLSALTLILKLPLLQGGEVRRCLFRDLLHGAMELLLDAQQQLTTLSLTSNAPATHSSVDLFSNLWDWPESIEGPFEQPLANRASCLQAASLAASLLSGLVQSKPLLLGPCVPHVVTLALVQALVSSNSLDEQAVFMEALQKLLSFVPSKTTQVDPGHSIIPVLHSLLEAWSDGLVLPTINPIPDLEEAKMTDASRWLSALVSLATACIESVPEDLKAHHAQALLPRLTRACRTADSMSLSLAPDHPFQSSLRSFQASTFSLLDCLLGSSWVPVDRIHPTDLTFILQLSYHSVAAQGFIMKILVHYFEPGEAIRGLTSQLEARGFKLPTKVPRPRPTTDASVPPGPVPGPVPDVVIIDDGDDAMIVEERPPGGAAAAAGHGTASQQKKRMRQTQIAFGEGKPMKTQNATNAPSTSASVHSSGQKGKKRTSSKTATPAGTPSVLPPGSTNPPSTTAPASSPPAATMSLPTSGGSNTTTEEESRTFLVSADVRASAEALLVWLESLAPGTHGDEPTKSTRSLLSLSSVLDALQAVNNNQLLSDYDVSWCSCCSLAPLIDLLSSIILSWIKVAASQPSHPQVLLQIVDSFIRLQVDRIANKRASCNCVPGSCIISGETEVAKKVLVEIIQAASTMVASSTAPGPLLVSFKVLDLNLNLALPHLPSSAAACLPNKDLISHCMIPILNALTASSDGSLAFHRGKEDYLRTCQNAVDEIKVRLIEQATQPVPIVDAALVLSFMVRLSGSRSLHQLAQAVQSITSKSSYANVQRILDDDDEEEEEEEEKEESSGAGVARPLVGLPFSSFATLLELFLSEAVKTSPQPLPSVAERSLLLLFHSLSWYLERAQAADLSGSGPSLRRLLSLLGSGQRLIQRLASTTLLPALLHPAPLYEAFGSPEDRSLAPAEKRLLADLRGMLDGDDKEMSFASNGSVTRAILDALTVSVERERLRSGIKIEVMLMAVGCLGATQPTVREAAASALSRICQFGSPMKGHEALRHALLKSSASNRVLEFVGRNVSDRPSLLLELSRLLGHGADTQPLALAVVPHVIGWLCVHQKTRELLILADILVSMPISDKEKIQQLFLSFVGQAVAYTFWVENDSVQPFMDFVEVIVAPDSFVKIGKVASKEIAIEVIKMSGLPSEWTQGADSATGQIQIEPSQDVIDRCRNYLEVLLHRIMERDKEPVGKLITGHVSTLLLKSVGYLFAPRQQQQYAMMAVAAVNGGRAPGQHYEPGGSSSRAPSGGGDNGGSSSHQVGKKARLAHPQTSGVSGGGLLMEDPEVDPEEVEDPEEAHKLQALRSLSVMIVLLKEYVANNLPQFMSVLAAGLRESTTRNLKMQALGTWRVFIKTLAEVSVRHKPSSQASSLSPLGRVAQQAVIVIMQSLEEVGGKTRRSAEVHSLAVCILEDIIIEHRDLVKGVLVKMPPLPSQPALERVNQALAKEQGRESNHKRHLSILLNSMRSDSIDVRLVAAGELLIFLETHRSLIMASASSSSSLSSSSRPLTMPTKSSATATATSSAASKGSSDEGEGLFEDVPGADLLSATLSALLRCCDNVMRTHQGRKLRLKCAECLGILGAIDPSRVVVPHPPPEPLMDPLVRGGSAALALEAHLIQKHLVRLLETDSIVFLEFSQYSMQSLLQIYAGGISSQGLIRAKPANGENALFSSLTPGVQELVMPFLFTRFTLEESGNQNLRKTSCRRWLELWLKSLSKFIVGPHQAAFASVSSVFKFDQRVMNFLLPHAVLNILIFGSSDAQKEVRSEIDFVLASSSSSPSTTTTNQEEAVPELELCLQTIFTLFDILGRWHKESQEQLALLALQLEQAQKQQVVEQQTMNDPSYVSPTVKTLQGSISQLKDPAQKVSSFLESISKKDLALAAFKCGAHARALKYYESFVRQEGGALNPSSYKPAKTTYKQDQVSFLLEIYGQLEEPDGLHGLVQLKRDGLPPMDQIKVAEKVGSWGEALALYETQLSLPPTSTAAANTNAANASNSQSPSVTDSLGERQSLELGRMRCLLSLGHLQGLLHQVNGLMGASSGQGDPKSSPDLKQRLAALGVAGSWRLGRWEALESYLEIAEGAGRPTRLPHLLSQPSSSSSSLSLSSATGTSDLQSSVAGQNEHLDVCIGRLLLSLHQGRYEAARLSLSAARSDILAILPAISQESYVRAYPLVARLHMLQEIEDGLRRLEAGPSADASSSAAAEIRRKWKERLDVAQGSLTIQEPLLAVRRQLAEILPGLQDEVGVTWLQYAKLCRSTSHPEAASTAVLEAATRGAPGAALEKAKLLWDQGKEHRAIVELQTALLAFEDPMHRIFGKPTVAGRRMHAKVALKLAKWTAEEGQMGYADLKNLFDSAIKVDEKWEKGHFEYGLYLDALYLDAKKRQQAGTGGPKLGSGRAADRLNGQSRVVLGEERAYYELLPEVLKSYGRAVELGGKHALHALPRIVTLYCDWGIEQNGGVTRKVKERTASTQVTNAMKDLAGNLPPTSWFLVLPQLISRICHPSKDVAEVIQSILVRVAQAFPQHVLWSMAAVCKSKVEARQRAANGIVSAARRAAAAHSEGRKVFDQFFPLLEQLIKLCHWQPKEDKKNPVTKVSAFSEFGSLVKILPVHVLVPVQSAFSSPLPPVSSSSSTAAGDSLVTITGLEDVVLVMQSLQKPKKICFRGSDGLSYPFLAKPKDDLRKDYRLMDFAGMLNQLFSKGAATRRRDLRIRTYAVLPLTEDCGILQWINNLMPFKNACEEILASEGVYKRREFLGKVRVLFEEWPAGSSRARLLDKVLMMLPPMLHRWFLAKFPEPASWLQARLNFTRTNAVWCMTGHMLGLGDRHGENILLDTTCGDTVHVDFGCLFDKGLTLQVPEMVPFRLTQNVIDAFGISGVEGTFRKCAEITLQVLRQHKEMFMTSAETFLYDPLVDWSASGGAHKAGDAGGEGGAGGEVKVAEIENPAAKDALSTIQGRLSGTLLGVLSQPSLPLSCEGHAQRLISEATDKEKLGSMYVWWQPWL